MGLIPQLTDGGRGLLIAALSGSRLNFTKLKIGNGAAPEEPEDDDMWYDTENLILFRYSKRWDESPRTITVSSTEPDDPSDNDLWFNPDTGILYSFGSGWMTSQINITCSATEPDDPQEGDYWYDTTYSTLKTYEGYWGLNDSVTITCSGTAPDSPSDGDYWYDTANEALKEYDAGNDEWTTSSQIFYYAATAPATPDTGDWWYDSTNAVLKKYDMHWDNDSSHTFTYAATAPSTPSTGDWWYDSANASMHEYGSFFAEDTEDSFVYAATAPTRPEADDLWYDTTESTLKIWATGWVEDNRYSFTYSQFAPLSPGAGDWWYDSANRLLYCWNGATWIDWTNDVGISCSASPPATQDTLQDLINPQITIEITGFEKGSNYVSLIGSFDNSDVDTTFNWSETGVFAEDEEGNEVLYAYCYTGENYETIPSKDIGKNIHTTLTVLVMVGDAEEVSATVGEGTVYASKEQLEEHKRDTANPHNVTAEQIGLGNVSNESPEDMTVDYETAASLDEPSTGETMSTFMGKVKKAINALILHLKASNPHAINPSKIGAAPSTHNHSAAEITTGVLPLARGGTGKTTSFFKVDAATHVDLNTITNPGVYQTGYNDANTPQANVSLLFVISSPNGVTQLCVPLISRGNIFFRTKLLGGSWAAWTTLGSN